MEAAGRTRGGPRCGPALATTAIAGALCLAAIPAGPANAETTFVPGTGTSSAGVARIQLRTSGAAIGFGLGVARTRFAGAQGNAEAASVDLGLFDTLSKAPLACGYSFDKVLPPGAVPARVAVSSGDGAVEKRTASAGEGGPLQFGSQYGAAAPGSSAAATVDGMSLDLPGVFQLLGGTASSTAKLVPGSQRQSSGDSALSRLSLAGGLVQLNGMHWTASHRTGALSDATAGFSVGSMTVGGTLLPTADPGQLASALAAANTALAPTGLSLGMPEVTRGADGIAVGPLRLSASATPTLRATLNATLEALQPLRSQLLTFVTPFQMSPACGLAQALGLGYLAVDLATLVLGEQGALDLDLGGAAAGTEGTAYANPFDSALGLINPGAGSPPALPAAPLSPVVPLTRPIGREAVTNPGEVLAAPLNSTAIAPVSSIALTSMFCRSAHGESCTTGHGRLAGWVAVCLIAALAAADRLRSRRT
jgi:hypothetical protein